jgi:hypothetical protein
MVPKSENKGIIGGGGSNTKYSQLRANGEYRKTRIFQLHNGEQMIKGDADLKQQVTYYYKNLFSPTSKQ